MEEQKTHTLKTWTKYFDAIARGDKAFEVRYQDRPYRVGDLLELLRFDPNTEEYTGESMHVKVTYILEGGAFGINRDYVVMSITTIKTT